MGSSVQILTFGKIFFPFLKRVNQVPAGQEGCAVRDPLPSSLPKPPCPPTRTSLRLTPFKSATDNMKGQLQWIKGHLCAFQEEPVPLWGPPRDYVFTFSSLFFSSSLAKRIKPLAPGSRLPTFLPPWTEPHSLSWLTAAQARPGRKTENRASERQAQIGYFEGETLAEVRTILPTSFHAGLPPASSRCYPGTSAIQHWNCPQPHQEQNNIGSWTGGSFKERIQPEGGTVVCFFLF